MAQRVAEELERRKDEIEAEVLRRVEEAKAIMERQMLEEIERRKQEQIEEARKREVRVVAAPARPPLGGGVIQFNHRPMMVQGTEQCNLTPGHGHAHSLPPSVQLGERGKEFFVVIGIKRLLTAVSPSGRHHAHAIQANVPALSECTSLA